MSQAPGRSGTPSAGHCSSAATRASCASSSAVPMSPTTRASPAMSRADSIRQIASIARCASAAVVSRRPGRAGASSFRVAMARAPSPAFMHGDLADLEGPAIVGCSLEPLECLVDRAHLPQPIAGNQLLALGERPVDDGALLASELNAFTLGARGEAARLEYHARLHQLFVELLVRSHRLIHRLGRWGSRRLALSAFLCHYQHPHVYLLLIRFPFQWTRAF